MKKTDSLFKQLHDANEKYKQLEKQFIDHTVGCEHWKGSKILLIEILKKDNKMLADKIYDINEIVDKEQFNTESNEFKIWQIINRGTE